MGRERARAARLVRSRSVIARNGSFFATMNGSHAATPMPCLLLIVVLAFPRVALALMFLFSNYLQRAYHGLLLPLLGFLFLPLTTIVYAWLVNSRMPIEGVNLVILIVAVVIDVGGLSSGEYSRRRR
jgi:hypothetical protein